MHATVHPEVLHSHLQSTFGRPLPTVSCASFSAFRQRGPEHPFSVGGKDRTVTLEATIGGEHVVLGLVAVGIGSADVVDWCAANALQQLVSAAGDDASGPNLAMAGQKVLECAERVGKSCPEPTGCMITMCALNRHRFEVTTIQVGAASAMIFARGKHSSPRLTEDHMLATSASEQRRLKEAGVPLAPARDGNGAPCGPLRAWPGGLTCARIVGNLGAEAEPIISGMPSLSVVALPPTGGDLLICSHGVWGELLESHIASLSRASPYPETAARIVVESAAAQHTSYYQEGYGVPLNDASCVLLRIGASRAPPSRGLSEAKLLNGRTSAFSRFRQKFFSGAVHPATPSCSTPSELSDASIRSGVSIAQFSAELSATQSLSLSASGTEAPSVADSRMDDVEDLDSDGGEPPMAQLDVGDGSAITVHRLLGEGGTAHVWEATWNERPIVVKVLKAEARTEAQTSARFEREVQIWQQLRHPCIIPLMHTGVTEARPWIASEHMAGGSLHAFLHEEPQTPAEKGLLSRVVAEVAAGIAYLHERGIIHRDVKTANVLLDEELHAKVADFGLSTFFDPAEHTAEAGTYRHMAPEIVLRKPYDHRCDVYSYGMLLWEVLHRQIPFPGLAPMQAAFAVALQDMRPTMALSSELEGYAGLICACWHADPEARPSMQTVAESTQQFFSQLTGQDHFCEHLLAWS